MKKLEFKKEDLIKSPLNYTGGKYKLLPQILPLFPDDIDTFVDLFCGGCDIGINVKANKIICNDIMTPIIDMYVFFKNNSYDDIIHYIKTQIEKFDLSLTNKEGYLKIRQQYNQYKYPLDLYICICYSFNHSIRFNSKNEFNIAFGKNRSYFNKSLEERLFYFINNIENINFINKDFKILNINKLKQNDFIYCDPPYLITCANYNENNGWNEDNEYALLNILDNLNKNNIKFALSNVLENKGKSNEILKKWSSNYNTHYLNHTYSNCNYQKKDKSKNSTQEVLITNY